MNVQSNFMIIESLFDDNTFSLQKVFNGNPETFKQCQNQKTTRFTSQKAFSFQ
jgi:hypothetical protein